MWTKRHADVYEHSNGRAIIKRHDRQTGLDKIPAGWQALIDDRPIREHKHGPVIEFRTWTGARDAANRRMRKAGIPTDAPQEEAAE